MLPSPLDEQKTLKQVALVVDDALSNRLMLQQMLEEQGFQVVLAVNGEEGVQKFIHHQPSVVLMDVQMPIMDGITATRKIKELSDGYFVPVIFITASEVEEVVFRCVEAGGDDFLQRPFSAAVLSAKVGALTRIRGLYNEIHGLHSLRQREEEIAEQLFSNAIERGNVALDQVKIYKRPAATFSGDVQLTAFRPNGDINILLGDFTGHGLTSVIGALPLSETFRAMTRKGYAGEEILQQINRKLHGLLPVGMFLAVTLVTVSSEESRAMIWNCGMPDALIFDGQTRILKAKVPSAEPPLGILKQLTLGYPVVLPVTPDDRILLMSDGVNEARGPDGDMFGEQRLMSAASNGMAFGNLMDQVVFSVDAFMAGRPQDDDVSLIEIPGALKNNSQAGMASLAVKGGLVSGGRPGNWFWELSLHADALRRINPVPILISQLQEMEGGGDHWQSVFTIATELYVNALDHGVLALDSSLKSSAEGFAEYFSERARRLDEITEGYVRISVKYTSLPETNGGRIRIRIKDSGDGFDYESWLDKLIDDEENTAPSESSIPMLSGRGIRLMLDLCEYLNYQEAGTMAEIGYAWSNEQTAS